MSGADDIIDFATARRQLKLRTGRGRKCDHERVTIDEDTLDVECNECEQRVEPAIVLLRIARRELELLWSRDEVRQRRQERDALKAEIKKLKAQARRARMRAVP